MSIPAWQPYIRRRGLGSPWRTAGNRRSPEPISIPVTVPLREWPKEQALVQGLMAPPPEIVFGDWYLAWNQAGLHLATIAMEYYDPELLAYGDTFPLEE